MTIEFEFWYTAILLIGLTIMLVSEFIEAELAIFSVLLLLIFGGVIDVNEAFSGFSNHGMLSVAALFVVAGALQRTGILDNLGDIILGKNGGISVKLIRLLLPTSTMSAFFNNTPIVAMLIPAIRTWANKHNEPISKYLIPLSYAAILGGTCTLIGTSTNLVVHGLMLDNGLQGMSFFEITKIGVPAAIVGLTGVILVVHKLLPERRDPVLRMGEQIREFVVVMRVEHNCKFLGKSIEAAGLRHLKGLFLFQVERNGQRKTPVGPDEKIQQNDYLFFTGLPETILELNKIKGLSLLKDKKLDLKYFDADEFGVFEAVVSRNSPLIGKNARHSKFRSNYNAVIIAIHRSGERIKEKIGDITLHGGDTLLILAPRDFVKRWYHSRDFYLVSRSIDINSKPHWCTYVSITILLTMILVMALGLVPVVAATTGAALLMVLSRCITVQDARESIDWKVLLIIASALGISKGLTNSGLASFLAQHIVSSLGSLGILGLLAGIYFLTNLYTEVITNNAAAALLVPVVLSVAGQMGIDPRPLLMAVTIGASASFSTPIGYQTNLMVYGPGGYRFLDFFKAGIPMNLLVGATAIISIYLLYY